MPKLISSLAFLLLAIQPLAADLADISAEQLLAEPASRVLDVRSAEEFAAGHLPGAVNIQHDQIDQRLGELGARDGQIVLYCRSGRRASLAAQVLQAAGFQQLRHLAGDFPGWQAERRPVEH